MQKNIKILKLEEELIVLQIKLFFLFIILGFILFATILFTPLGSLLFSWKEVNLFSILKFNFILLLIITPFSIVYYFYLQTKEKIQESIQLEHYLLVKEDYPSLTLQQIHKMWHTHFKKFFNKKIK